MSYLHSLLFCWVNDLERLFYLFSIHGSFGYLKSLMMETDRLSHSEALVDITSVKHFVYYELLYMFQLFFICIDHQTMLKKLIFFDQSQRLSPLLTIPLR